MEKTKSRSYRHTVIAETLEDKLNGKSPRCPAGWKQYKNHCYYFSSDKMSWFEAERKCRNMGAYLKSRVEFDKSMDHAISWLEQKEDILASCTAQEMEPDKVMGSLQKHNALAREALDKIAAVKDQAKLEKAHYEKMGEPMPATMQDKLNQIQNSNENSWIKKTITSKLVKQQYWLGAADHLKEGDWRWMNDLSKVQYSGWHPNEPNNYGGNEDCALISIAHSSLSWNDGTCKSSLGYICENQKGSMCLPCCKV
ncbi:Hypothetical predicted protein [Mytilus galloprovincialis]|uniref:C-type lectin domain-containing protein n=1 Tax=Mytilus galloprovincialis TaxID=29158 RepID=A0A8B6F150_MYTGA|nr:Hypothetical predicted protein [Mytilus galloprovincialis]